MTHTPKLHLDGVDRRYVLAGAAGLALLPVTLSPARATPETMAAAIKESVGTADVKRGRVTIEAPRLAENGNSVQIIVKADSPMTAEDYVKTIAVFSEKNPIATLVRFHVGPRAGVARVSTSIRLAATPTITAIATMSDGSHWSGDAEVVVTLAACLDGG
ncbi:MAG: SoxY-related AACIE arm protein [Hyphomicrobiaceae bacterium]